MNVTRNVVVDLLPAYAADELHPDSARLVETWLADDPTLARELESLRNVGAALGERAPRTVPAAELEALRRTRFALRLQSVLMGFAILFTALPFTVVFRNEQMWWLARENPGLAITSGAAAVAMWLGWALFAARLRVRSGV